MPYYWNIAPNRDATFTPALSTRRGAGLESEFRYLEPSHRGEVRLNLLPFDRLTDTRRYALTGCSRANSATSCGPSCGCGVSPTTTTGRTFRATSGASRRACWRPTSS